MFKQEVDDAPRAFTTSPSFWGKANPKKVRDYQTAFRQYVQPLLEARGLNCVVMDDAFWSGYHQIVMDDSFADDICTNYSVVSAPNLIGSILANSRHFEPANDEVSSRLLSMKERLSDIHALKLRNRKEPAIDYGQLRERISQLPVHKRHYASNMLLETPLRSNEWAGSLRAEAPIDGKNVIVINDTEATVYINAPLKDGQPRVIDITKIKDLLADLSMGCSIKPYTSHALTDLHRDLGCTTLSARRTASNRGHFDDLDEMKQVEFSESMGHSVSSQIRHYQTAVDDDVSVSEAESSPDCRLNAIREQIALDEAELLRHEAELRRSKEAILRRKEALAVIVERRRVENERHRVEIAEIDALIADIE